MSLLLFGFDSRNDRCLYGIAEARLYPFIGLNYRLSLFGQIASNNYTADMDVLCDIDGRIGRV